TFLASIDGAAPVVREGVNTDTGGLNYFSIGADFTGQLQTAPIHFFLDDVVVATAPIGCD
ncbi:MAG: hypothetical protein ACKV2T_20575, partial [Kofleriaceae bacterium]